MRTNHPPRTDAPPYSPTRQHALPHLRPDGGAVPVASLGDYGRHLQLAALSLDTPEVLERQRQLRNAALAQGEVYSLDPSTSSEEEDYDDDELLPDFTHHGTNAHSIPLGSTYTAPDADDVPRRIPISNLHIITGPPDYSDRDDISASFRVCHARLLGRLLDPRLPYKDRELHARPDDDRDTCYVFGAHRLPRAWDVQRALLWRVVRLPLLADIPNESAHAMHALVGKLERDIGNTRDLMAGIGSEMLSMVAEVRQTTARSKKGIFELANAPLWQDLCELTMQYNHEENVSHVIQRIMRIGQGISSHTACVPQYGQPFWRQLLMRREAYDFYPLDVAVNAGFKVKEEADRAGEYATAASVYLLGFATVLPWYPSQWLMEQWEARACGLGDFYTKTALNLAACLQRMKQFDVSRYAVIMLEDIVTITNRESSKVAKYLADAEIGQHDGVHPHLIDLDHMKKFKHFSSLPPDEYSRQATFHDMTPNDFSTFHTIIALHNQAKRGQRCYYLREDSEEAQRIRRWHREVSERKRVWQDERGMEDDDELAAKNRGRMVDRVNWGPEGY